MASHGYAGESTPLDVCRVERWRGYTSSRFFVRTPDGALYESTAFRSRRRGVAPDDPAALSAYEDLVEQLVADGWTAERDGESWYETTFSRARTQPAPAAAPPPPAPLEAPPSPPAAAVRVAPLPSVRIARPAGARPRLRWAAIGAAAVVCVVAFAVIALRGGAPAAPRAHRAPTHPAALPVRSPKPARTPPQRRGPAALHIVITAVRGSGSWIEARRDGPTGKVLFAGVLPPGHRLRLTGARIWTRFGAAANLAISENGRPVVLTGTYDKLFHAPSPR